MEKFDLGIAYLWEYDKDFVNLIERELQSKGLSTFIIGAHNVHEATAKIIHKELAFNFFLDRASDVDDDFAPLASTLTKKKTIVLNPYKRVQHAIDKATMHLEFITAGIHVPYSFIMPPLAETHDVYLSISDLAQLGRPFIIKPCNTTGGGLGVVTGAETLEEVMAERPNYYHDKYILQQKIYPAILDGKRAWFRCYWAFGKPIPTWWDDETHIYQILTSEQLENLRLKRLYSITKIIASLTGLDFFSTEIVFAPDGQFYAIDYVNDQCDMRFQSAHYDGVPDVVIRDIVTTLRKKLISMKRKLHLD
jgi:hypothetical protein